MMRPCIKNVKYIMFVKKLILRSLNQTLFLQVLFNNNRYICNTIVRRCIWRIYYPRPRSEEVFSRYTPSRRQGSNCKLPMTEVKGSMIRDIHLLTMIRYSSLAPRLVLRLTCRSLVPLCPTHHPSSCHPLKYLLCSPLFLLQPNPHLPGGLLTLVPSSTHSTPPMMKWYTGN